MVKFAPWSIPFERRLQTFAVMFVMFLFVWFILLNVVVLAFFWVTWPFYAAYLLWIFTLDRNAAVNGGRTPYLRHVFIPGWRLFREYFPARMISEEKLNSKQTYVFACHPHGLIGMSFWANLMNSVSPILRDIDYRICTLKSNFWIPFARELILYLGLIAADKSGIRRTLKKGTSVAIVIGGAAESLLARPNAQEIVLERRKGFIQLALETGSHLVPVYSFGENAIYNQVANPEGSKLRNCQEWMKTQLGFTLPAFHGRGIFNYDLGIMPFRKPILTVIGKPIPVPKIERPTLEEIVKYHTIYKTHLLELHEKYRNKMGVSQLKIVA